MGHECTGQHAIILELLDFMVLHEGHVDTPEDGDAVNEGHLELHWDEHERHERDERPHLPASQQGGPKLLSDLISRTL